MEWATLAIAITGALTGLSSLGWQIYTSIDARKLKIEVEVGNSIIIPDTEPLHVVGVTVINRNDHAIRVQSVGLNLQKGRAPGRLFFPPQSHANLPGEIAPHDSGFSYIEYRHFEEEMDPNLPVVAVAVTSAHGAFESKPTHLGPSTW